MNLKVDFKANFQYLIPLQVRGAKFVAWLGSMLAPLQSLNATFKAWGDGQRYNLQFTGQVVYLERILNDLFDNSLRRIYIADPAGQYAVTTFLWNRIEAQATTYFYNKAEAATAPTVRNRSEVFVALTDFVVKIPASLNVTLTKNQMKKIINRYRQAGKQYIFETI